jgi:hypothetical protein
MAFPGKKITLVSAPNILMLPTSGLVDQGITPCLVGAWGYYLPWMGPEKMKAHWRYLVARYGAWPVVWCAAGEGNLPWYLVKGFPYDDREQVHGWTEILRYIRQVDPWHRPLTIHPTAIKRYTSRHATDDDSLIDFDLQQTLQTGRAAVPVTVTSIRESYEAKPTMPVLVGEGNYERLNDKLETQWTRAIFWLSMTNGAAGHTYGANGLWQVNRRGQPHGASPHGGNYGQITWDEAMVLPGSTQIANGIKFFARLPWTKLKPMPDGATWEDTANIQVAPQTCGIEDQLRVIYAVESRPIIARILKPQAKYEVTLFDPVEGKSTDPLQLMATAAGELRMTPPSHGHDWVVLLKRHD